ncbi:MAG TPA: hypothetical protein VK934_06265, partial [Fimbriimonas sp.]|nr:hypothetical protein [Fimbriimonas sp.]
RSVQRRSGGESVAGATVDACEETPVAFFAAFALAASAAHKAAGPDDGLQVFLGGVFVSVEVAVVLDCRGVGVSGVGCCV